MTVPTPRAGTVLDRRADLARRFAAGDERALAELYAEHAASLLVIATRMLADRRVAEEAVQQAFVQAWRAAPRFDPERPLAPWLRSILRRTAVDAWRRERRHDARALDEVAPAELPTVVPRAIEDLSDTWDVRRALDRLAAPEREVVRLSHLEQLTHPEIAARLGIPVGTVKSRTHSAHGKLRAALSSAVEV